MYFVLFNTMLNRVCHFEYTTQYIILPQFVARKSDVDKWQKSLQNHTTTHTVLPTMTSGPPDEHD
jgi:hypothetical protein